MAGHEAIIAEGGGSAENLIERYNKLDSVEKRDMWGVIVSAPPTDLYRERYDQINWGHGKED